MVYQQLRRWMEGELGFHFGPQAATTPASDDGGSADAPTEHADPNATRRRGRVTGTLAQLSERPLTGASWTGSRLSRAHAPHLFVR